MHALSVDLKEESCATEMSSVSNRAEDRQSYICKAARCKELRKKGVNVNVTIVFSEPKREWRVRVSTDLPPHPPL